VVTLKESFNFGSTIKGEELLKKLYIDIVCKHEIYVRKLKKLSNSEENNLYIIDTKIDTNIDCAEKNTFIEKAQRY